MAKTSPPEEEEEEEEEGGGLHGALPWPRFRARGVWCLGVWPGLVWFGLHT